MRQSYISTFFNDFEKQISDILLQLPQLFMLSQSLRLTWGAKRKRSAIDSTSSTATPLLDSTPSSQPSILRTCVVGEDDDEKIINNTEATSPATPLSFPPSESDGKSKRKNSKKKKKDELLEEIDGLTQYRELLQGRFESVKRNYEELKAQNLELKAIKQELSFRGNKEKPNLEINREFKLAMQSTEYIVKSPTPENHIQQQQIPSMVHQPPLIINRTAYKPFENVQYPRGQMTALESCGIGLVGPIAVPDLNISFEENFGMGSCQPLDVNSSLAKAMAAAEARRKRMKIYKEKNSIASKPRHGPR